MRIVRTVGVGIVGAAGLVAAGASAHHSTAAVYDRGGAIIEAEGVITEVAWVNPHVLFKMRGAGADGVERLWEIETNSVSIISRFGLTAELVSVGNRVRVAGNGGRQADNVMWLTNMLLPNGSEILFGGGIRPRWSQQTIGRDIRGAVTADSSGLGIFRVWTNATGPPVFWGNNFPLTEAAAAVRADFDPLRDDPTANCAPKGMPYIMEQPYPIELVRDGDDILLKMEEYDTVRRFVMTRDAPAATGARSPLGVSHGRWEGDVLAVTTTRIGSRWLNGSGIPLGPDAALEERFSLTADGSRLEYTLTVTDPSTFSSPVTLRKAWEWRPGERVNAYECRR